ncbi:cytochrome P450 [Streptomyces gamaensis]|uniref:Cytochrome P450 n=1 Tax=Streptomyces gamaensis TaxID=1763542 RepID=A0ABW0Z899_9ACTN
MTFPFPPGPRGTVPPRYARLLADEPVSEVTLADGTTIRLVTRYEDVRTVLSSERFSRYRAAVLPGTGLGRSQGTGLVDLDPPAHTRLRDPVAAAFAPGRTARLRPRIEAVADGILDALPAGDGPVDLVGGYTAPFAGRVVCELLGLPGEQWRQFTGGAETLLTPGLPEARARAARLRLRDALLELLTARRETPGDDVASVLLSDGGQLTDDERVLLLHGLIVSGFIGVRDLLARHLFALLAEPALLARLVREPAAIPAAVGELLRYYPSSNDGLLRVATEDVVLSGTLVPAGAPVLPLVSAASRDPGVFDRPDVLDIDRPPGPGHGLAFGAGRHACPAADLAVTELSVGVGRLLAAFPALRLAVAADEVEHSSALLPLGIPALPVVPGPRR